MKNNPPNKDWNDIFSQQNTCKYMDIGQEIQSPQVCICHKLLTT